MAIRLATVAPTGDEYPAAYFRVVGTVLYHVDGVGTIIVHGWRDEAARRAGKQPICKLEYQVRAGTPGVDAVLEEKDAEGNVTRAAVAGVQHVPGFAEVFGDDAPPLTASYRYLAQLPEFAAGERV